jgi:hypothetical protein
MSTTQAGAVVTGNASTTYTWPVPDRETLAAVPHRWAQPPDSMVSKIPKGNTLLDYVGHADVTLMLIDVDPAWEWRPAAYDPETGGPRIQIVGQRAVLWGFLTVCGVTRMCVGTCQANKGEPEKELIGDLLRNGAMRFGIATSLWSKSEGMPDGDSGGGFERHHQPESQHKPDHADELIQAMKEWSGTVVADAMKAVAAEHGKHLSANAMREDKAWFGVAESAFIDATNEYHAQKNLGIPEPEMTATAVANNPTMLTASQRKQVMAIANSLGLDREQRLVYARAVIDRDITSFNDLTKAEASKVIDAMISDQEKVTIDDAQADEQDRQRDDPF